MVGTVDKRGNSKALLIFAMLILFAGAIAVSSFNDTPSNSTFIDGNPDNSSATMPNITGPAGIKATGNETSVNQTLLPEGSTPLQNVALLPNQTGEQAFSAMTNLSVRTNQTPQLARKVNNVSIDTPYITDYLKLYKNFSDIQHEKVSKNSTVKARLALGAKEDTVRGFEMGHDRYAIHLILCNHNTKTCAFRINGVATGALAAVNDNNAEASSKFALDENSTLEITGIQLDYCDGRRFCNVYYEAYDLVNLTVITR